MSQPITRLYEKKKSALDAVTELKANGFLSEIITIVTPADAKAAKADAASDDGLVAAIAQAGIPKAAAAIYAERVRSGASVVSITPNWGTGKRATKILDNYGPVEVEIPAAAAQVKSVGVKIGASDLLGQDIDWKGSAPLSKFFGWPLLLDNAAPLSSQLNCSVTSKKTFFFLEGNKGSALSNDPTPLSSKLKLPLLSDKVTPLSDRMLSPVLSDNATPLSSWLKMPLLSKDPTPCSSWLKIPVLR